MIDSKYEEWENDKQKCLDFIVGPLPIKPNAAFYKRLEEIVRFYFMISTVIEQIGNKSVAIKGFEEFTEFKGEVINFSFTDDRRKIALMVANTETPGDLWLYEEGKEGFKRLTEFNKEFLDKLSISTPEEFHYPSDDGYQIHGWVLKPPDFDPDKKYPMILEIHGGPRCQYANVFFFEFAVNIGNDRRIETLQER